MSVEETYDDRPLLTKEEAAARLRLKVRTLDGIIQRGEIETIVVSGRSRRIEPRELDRYIASRREGGGDD